MRIIAGTARGRKIFSVPVSSPVKPISDRIKQSVFDIIRPKITASLFLDLFAGTGAVGLEALSRGAQKVVFVDREPVCLKAIKRNCENLGFSDKARILKADVTAGLEWLGRYSDGEGYDIIFLGTPYRDAKNRMLSLTGKVLASLSSCAILADGGIVVAQHHRSEEFSIPDKFEVFRTSDYGDTRVTFLRPGRAGGPA